MGVSTARRVMRRRISLPVDGRSILSTNVVPASPFRWELTCCTSLSVITESSIASITSPSSAPPRPPACRRTARR